MALVDIQGISKKYADQYALNNLTLSLEEGEQYAILGASGSGKSTLLYLLGGLEKADAGTINVSGRDLSKLSDSALAKYRNELVGFVFQFHFLLPSMTCEKNILLPAEIGSHKMAKVRKKIHDIAEHLGVAHCLKKYPYQLSGGEQQRINITRALSLTPKLLRCDEPTGNLDSENSAKVTDLIQDLAKEFGSTLAVVTHDPGVAKKFSKKFVLKDGHLSHESFFNQNDSVPPTP